MFDRKEHSSIRSVNVPSLVVIDQTHGVGTNKGPKKSGSAAVGQCPLEMRAVVGL